MNETMNNYEAPLVEVIEMEVEKGFASSGDGSGETGGWDPGA